MARHSFAIILGLFLFLVGSAGLNAQSLPQTFMYALPVTNADAAVQEAVLAGGEAYAGDCALATPANIGQECSKFVAANGALRAYMVGRAFSEFTDWVFVGQTQAGWVPLTSAAFDDSSGPPAVPWPGT